MFPRGLTMLTLVMVIAVSWSQADGQPSIGNTAPTRQAMGAAPGYSGNGSVPTDRSATVIIPRQDGEYTTYTYTFDDLVIFSYVNDTEVSVTRADGSSVWSGTLGTDSYRVLSPGEGVYGIACTAPVGLLNGDPITHSVMGYFAMDETGRGAGTRFLTYMPRDEWGQERFIIISHANDNLVQLRDLGSGSTIWMGILNRGEHFSSSSIEQQFLRVVSTDPVSVLSYADQGYAIPAENGLWSGTSFLGYAGFVGEWENKLTVISFVDNNAVTIRNAETGAVIWLGEVDGGSFHKEILTTEGTQEVYFEIETEGTAIACVSPYYADNPRYYHLLDCCDETGHRIGTTFLLPANNNEQIDFSSFVDANSVTIENLTSGLTEWSGMLEAGESVNTTTDSHALYRVQGTGYLTGCKSGGGAHGGSFVPMYYGLDMPDLAIVRTGIDVSPSHPSPGQQVSVGIEVTNLGGTGVSSVGIELFDGDPQAGGIRVGYAQVDETIPPYGGTTEVTVVWTTPENPDHSVIYCSADPDNEISESSETNNTASRPLIANEDLSPPLVVVIDAPSGLSTDDSGNYLPDPIVITAHIANVGQTTVYGTYAELNLPAGLMLKAGETVSHSIGMIASRQSTTTTWEAEATGSPHGFRAYWIDVVASGVPEKRVRRKLHVPTPPVTVDVYAGWNGQAIGDARVFRDGGAGFELVGTTGDIGQPVQIANLAIGDRLRASALVHTEDAVKDGHDEVDDVMFEVWVDSDVMNYDGSYSSFEVTSVQPSYLLTMNHRTAKYCLVLSAEWALDNDYYNRLESGLKEVSRLLYNATDGQAMLWRIAVYDEEEHDSDADIILEQSIEGNSAHVNGIDKALIFPFTVPHLFMHRRHIYNDHWPNENDWFHSMVHELGHYAFGLYDEYLNGDNVNWRNNTDYNWDPGGDEHPLNYGLMQTHHTTTEFSSANDYLDSYPDDVPDEEITYQWRRRGMPCWDWIAGKLNDYYDNFDLTLPPHGRYPDGYIYDRLGPDAAWVEDSTRVLDLRAEGRTDMLRYGDGPFESSITVTDGITPVPAAHVYVHRPEGLHRIYLGKTRTDGTVHWSGAFTASTIDAHATRQGLSLSTIHPVSAQRGTYTVDLADGISTRSPETLRDGDPGVVVSAEASYAAGTAYLSISVLFDQTPSSTPTAEVSYGEVTEPLILTQVGSTDEYTGSVELDGSTPGFDGAGWIDITVVDRYGSRSSFTSIFTILGLGPDDSNTFFLRGLEMALDGENFAAQQVGVLIATLAQPYAHRARSLLPVTPMFAVAVESGASLPSGGALNVYYEPSEVVGLDETSIGIHKWDSGASDWEVVSDSRVDVGENVVSCTINSAGIFGVFATAESSDNDPPGRINDLGTATGFGHASLYLNWTAPGDDGQDGQAANYIMRYNLVPITHLNWDSSLDASGEPSPASAGAQQSMSLTMPRANQLYYFAVAVEDEAGNQSDVSNCAPAVSSVQSYTFSLLSPAFNDTLGTQTPHLRWECLQSDSSATYTLWLSDDSLFETKTVVSGLTELSHVIDNPLRPRRTYYWKVFASTATENTVWCNQSYFRFATSGVTPPTGGQLSNESVYVYPNPFNPDEAPGTIRFSLDEPGQVTIRIYDVTSRLVRTFVEKRELDADQEHAFDWDGRDDDDRVVANGVYFFVIASSSGEKGVGKAAVLR